MDPRRDVIPARPRHVLPPNVADAQPRAVAVAVAVDARADVDGLVDVLHVEVAERHVAHVALPRVRLDPGGVAGVDAADVLVEDVVDEVDRVVTEGADYCAPGFVAGDVVDVDVAAITFD